MRSWSTHTLALLSVFCCVFPGASLGSDISPSDPIRVRNGLSHTFPPYLAAENCVNFQVTTLSGLSPISQLHGESIRFAQMVKDKTLVKGTEEKGVPGKNGRENRRENGGNGGKEGDAGDDDKDKVGKTRRRDLPWSVVERLHRSGKSFDSERAEALGSPGSKKRLVLECRPALSPHLGVTHSHCLTDFGKPRETVVFQGTVSSDGRTISTDFRRLVPTRKPDHDPFFFIQGKDKDPKSDSDEADSDEADSEEADSEEADSEAESASGSGPGVTTMAMEDDGPVFTACGAHSAVQCEILCLDCDSIKTELNERCSLGVFRVSPGSFVFPLLRKRGRYDFSPDLHAMKKGVDLDAAPEGEEDAVSLPVRVNPLDRSPSMQFIQGMRSGAEARVRLVKRTGAYFQWLAGLLNRSNGPQSRRAMKKAARVGGSKSETAKILSYIKKHRAREAMKLRSREKGKVEDIHGLTDAKSIALYNKWKNDLEITESDEELKFMNGGVSTVLAGINMRSMEQVRRLAATYRSGTTPYARVHVRNTFADHGTCPMAFAHRGVSASSDGVENSLVALMRSIMRGYDGAEVDVMLTGDDRDGYDATVLHDTNIDRLTGIDMDIIDMDSRKTRRFDAVRRALHQCHIFPSLMQVLTIASAFDFNLDIELKPESPFAKVRKGYSKKLGLVVGAAIREARMEKNVVVTAFDPRKLKFVNDLDAAPVRRRKDRNYAAVEINTVHGYFAAPDDKIYEKLGGGKIPVGLARHGSFQSAALYAASNALNLHGGAKSRIFQIGRARKGNVARTHRRGGYAGLYTFADVLLSAESKKGKKFYDPETVKEAVEMGIDWIEADDMFRLYYALGLSECKPKVDVESVKSDRRFLATLFDPTVDPNVPEMIRRQMRKAAPALRKEFQEKLMEGDIYNIEGLASRDDKRTVLHATA